MIIFITGASGFIGSNLAKRILTTEPDTKVIGLDNMNDYYDVRIKEARLAELQKFENYTFIKGNLADKALINSIFEQYHPDIVVNLGAQAGVRYSITNPDAYIESNMIGFYNILEACRHYPVQHLVYASSSSVYGSNKKVPYSTDDKVDNPVSLYAATKKSNELMAHAYSKLYNIPSTGLRFFTVYGPAGRPDMAYFGFTNKLVNGETIKIFNYGNCKRDFTYALRQRYSLAILVQAVQYYKNSIRIIGAAAQSDQHGTFLQLRGNIYQGYRNFAVSRRMAGRCQRHDKRNKKQNRQNSFHKSLLKIRHR